MRPHACAPGPANRTKSYPCREAAGFVWAWMGAPEEMREFEPPAWAPAPGIRTSIVKIHVACNWAQVLEGAIDVTEGGTAIPYWLEDPFLREEYEATLKKVGVASRMDASLYVPPGKVA